MRDSTFLTDDLVVKLQIDIRVFVPSSLRKTIFVEFLQSGEFLQRIVVDRLGDFAFGLGFWQLSDTDDVVSHTWHELNASVGQHVDLFYLVSPEIVAVQRLAQR